MLLKKHDGLTLLEIVISMVILSVVVIAIAHFQGTSLMVSENVKDKEFAARKAIALLEEVKASLEKAVDLNEAIATIEDTEDNFVLTLHETATPDHPLSGNYEIVKGDGEEVFRFSRRITFERFGGVANANVKMAKVTISVHYRDGRIVPIVGVGTIVQVPLQLFPPSQVYDVYLLTAESSPSWWVHMSQTRDNFESQLIDLMSRNPGLTFRTHFITANGYGRNPMYLPYINQSQSSTVDKMAFGYIYPGTHEYNDGTSNAGNPGMYYFPEIFQARYNMDGILKNDYQGISALTNPSRDKVYNPFPHTFCDRFNQDMRYPDALYYLNKKLEARKEYIQQRRIFLKQIEQEIKTKGSSSKNPNDMPELSPEEPSFRILLEQMVSQPEKFHNAIFLNLHGELLPLPSMRNYSDPAKDPLSFPGVRVVTHPEKIWTKKDKATPGNTEDLKLRVYSYLSDLTRFDNAYNKNSAGQSNQTSNRMPVPITIVLKNVDLTANINNRLGNGQPSLRIKRIVGGYPWTRSGADSDYASEESAAFVKKAATETETEESLGSILPDEMYVRYRALKVDTNNDNVPDTFHTVLYLFNSPLSSPLVNNRGLRNDRRLYNLEYIPTPVVAPDASENFKQDLTNATAANFKNTARWVIIIPRQMVISGNSLRDPNNTLSDIVVGQDSSTELRIETRIGTDLGTPTKEKDQFIAGVGVLTEKNNHSGTMYPPEKRFKPENLSTTYAWWSTILTAVPFTELFQYTGDPRHNPYVDNIAKDSWVNATSGTVGDGYNCYWDDINNWDAVIDDAATQDGWGNDRIEIDLPRYQQLVRRAILNSELLYTTLTGYSYYYASVGGEIGVDSANGFPKSVQVNDAPFGGTGASSVFVDEYAGFNNSRIHYIKKVRSTTHFPLLFWLGELYHDDDYLDQWGIEITKQTPSSQAFEPFKVLGGNVIARNGNNYQRVKRNDGAFRAENTNVTNNSGLLRDDCKHRLDALGCGAILHIQNSSGKIFTHYSTTANSTIQNDGKSLASEYSLPLPGTISSSRPWNVEGTAFANQFDMVNHSYWRNRFFVMLDGSDMKNYYNHSGTKIASGLLRLELKTGTTNLALSQIDPYFKKENYGYVAVNGLDRATVEATSTINKLSLLTLLHSFLELGSNYQTRMLPRLRITKPDVSSILPRNPGTITTAWSIDFKRWDGRTYTPAYSSITYPPSVDQGFPFRLGTESQEVSNLFFVPMITDDIRLPWTDLIQLQKGVTDQNLLLRESGDRPVDPSGQFNDYRVGGGFIQTNLDGEFTFNLPLGDKNLYPAGSYFFRVECFRLNEQQHFSYHQVVLEVKR